MDSPRDYHERMKGLTQAFGEMTQELATSIHGLSETTKELTELMITENSFPPRLTDTLVKGADDRDRKGESTKMLPQSCIP